MTQPLTPTEFAAILGAFLLGMCIGATWLTTAQRHASARRAADHARVQQAIADARRDDRNERIVAEWVAALDRDPARMERGELP